MSIRIGCCLNLPPPTTTTNSFSPKTTQLPICSNRRVEEERNRTVPRAIRVASVVILGLEMINSVNVETQYAMAEQVSRTMTIKPQQQQKRLTKWSDKRTCPPWRVNLLESIVPENLPRPSTRRRWEKVNYSAAEAPPVKFYYEMLTGDCFSL